MPNRIIREQIRRSATLAQLTGDEERMFWRLLVVCDDFGRFDGRPQIIRAECFQAMLDKVSVAKVLLWIAKLVKVGLVHAYVVDGCDYIQIPSWEKYQEKRAKRSKWPDPLRAAASTCAQMPAIVPETRDTRHENRDTSSSARGSRLPEPFDLSEAMTAFGQKAGIDVRYEFGKFKDYHRAKGTVHRDWVSAWRYWVRNALERQEARTR